MQNKPHVFLSPTTMWARKRAGASACHKRSDLGGRGCLAKSALFSRHERHIFPLADLRNLTVRLRTHSLRQSECPALIVDKRLAFKLASFSGRFVIFILHPRFSLISRQQHGLTFSPRGNRKFMFINSDHPKPAFPPSGYK